MPISWLTGLGPPALMLRTEDKELDARLDRLASEAAVREHLDGFNRRIVEARRQLSGGARMFLGDLWVPGRQWSQDELAAGVGEFEALDDGAYTVGVMGEGEVYVDEQMVLTGSRVSLSRGRHRLRFVGPLSEVKVSLEFPES